LGVDSKVAEKKAMVILAPLDKLEEGVVSELGALRKALETAVNSKGDSKGARKRRKTAMKTATTQVARAAASIDQLESSVAQIRAAVKEALARDPAFAPAAVQTDARVVDAEANIQTAKTELASLTAQYNQM
jgi:chromosome segregation ATPase